METRYQSPVAQGVGKRYRIAEIVYRSKLRYPQGRGEESVDVSGLGLPPLRLELISFSKFAGELECPMTKSAITLRSQVTDTNIMLFDHIVYCLALACVNGRHY